METRVKFCKTITEKFESGEIDIKKIVFFFPIRLIFGWMDSSIKKSFRFWVTENPNISISKSLHPEKVTLSAAFSVKGIYLFDSTVTENNYRAVGDKVLPLCKKPRLG